MPCARFRGAVRASACSDRRGPGGALDVAEIEGGRSGGEGGHRPSSLGLSADRGKCGALAGSRLFLMSPKEAPDPGTVARALIERFESAATVGGGIRVEDLLSA